jgi:hypothetical protein
MNAPTKVVGFVLGVAAAFLVAYAVGTQVGPVSEPAEAAGHSEEGGHSEGGHSDGGETSAGSEDAAALPGGLMVSEGGYTLALGDSVARAGRGREISFVIEGPGGPVTAYDVLHEKQLHFIAVRRDFTGFQHVHPRLSEDGTWTTHLDLTPGQWRVFADFKPTDGEAHTLGSDLSVPGRVDFVTLGQATRTATVDDYTIELSGDLVAGEHSMLELRVSRDGRPVTDLQPYLGAYGHLVALRGGDLAYLHVHPDGEPFETPRSSAPQEPPGDGKTEPGPQIEFGAEVPSDGTYHLYLDFKHDGVVRTAHFQLDATAPAGSR